MNSLLLQNSLDIYNNFNIFTCSKKNQLYRILKQFYYGYLQWKYYFYLERLFFILFLKYFPQVLPSQIVFFISNKCSATAFSFLINVIKFRGKLLPSWQFSHPHPHLKTILLSSEFQPHYYY